MKQENHISFCTDKNYAAYTGVALTSIILNNSDKPLDFHILYSTLDEADREKYLSLPRHYDNVTMKLYDLSGEKRTSSYKTTNRYPKTVYLRWYIPDIVDSSIKCILYMDGDVLCLGNLKKLLDFDFILQSKYPLAAVGKTQSPAEISRLKLTQDRTINAGVLLLNLLEWRNHNLGSKLFHFTEQHNEELLWLDNDVLNRVLDGNFYMLEEKWNHRLYLHKMPNYSILPEDIIVHYSGPMKPWHENCRNKNKEIWWSYAKKSLWSDLNPVRLETG